MWSLVYLLVYLGDLTLGAVDRIDGLFPAGVLLRPSRQTALLIQVELEPHGQSIQLPLLDDGQVELLNLPGAQALQVLQVTIIQQSYKHIKKLGCLHQSYIFILITLNMSV